MRVAFARDRSSSANAKAFVHAAIRATRRSRVMVGMAIPYASYRTLGASRQPGKVSVGRIRSCHSARLSDNFRLRAALPLALAIRRQAREAPKPGAVVCPWAALSGSQSKEEAPVPDIFIAYERAVNSVGISNWRELSDADRTKLFNDELARLGAERRPVTAIQPLDENPQL
jgi:hypothetical protein